MMSMLIGMSAARRGSMHPAIAKMLCLHIPALHPPSFTELELEVQAIVQIAALLGIGLLYQVHHHRPGQPRCFAPTAPCPTQSTPRLLPG
jgi:anaphase-promoting complex subunit 1